MPEANKLLIITLCDADKASAYRRPEGSFGVNIDLRPQDLEIDAKDFIARFISPSIRQILATHEDRKEKV